MFSILVISIFLTVIVTVVFSIVFSPFPKPILCFLSVRPSIQFYNLCVRFVGKYKVFICIDDNDYNVPWGDDPNISIIRDDPKDCVSQGYHSTVIYFQDTACARDKALRYFCDQTFSDKQMIWFIEEDVLIPHVTTLTNIDKKYKKPDLLCRDLIPKSEAKDWRFWHLCPFSDNDCIRTMICAIRLSGKACRAIKKYAVENKSLFMDEILFPSLIRQQHLTIFCPDEFQNILYRDDEQKFPTQKEFVNPNFLYHPYKNLDLQSQLIQ